MTSGDKQLLRIAGLLVGMGISLFAGEFAPPAEGPVAFRRDKIPMDADALTKLSTQLETLARGLDTETATHRRGAAQMLALALAVDPANTKARELISECQQARHLPKVEDSQLDQCRAGIWQSIAWLETPEAGSQGQALATCLKDVIIISDPEHPKAGALREAGEKGAWAGWIPSISAYKPKAVVRDGVPKVDQPAVPPVTKPAIRLEKARVQTVLWKKNGNHESANWILAPADILMSAVESEEEEDHNSKFSMKIGSGEGSDAFRNMANMLKALLGKQHGNLPDSLQVSIHGKELEESIQSNKNQSVSAAAAVLASSAITGCEPDAIIVGRIDETGAFKLSSGFWNQLRSLGKGTGQRLVLPLEASPYLLSVLAMEKPEFFMEYEVFLAADFKQLLALTAKTPNGTLASSVAKFREVREKSKNQEIRQYIANSFVKQRLMAVLQETPSHFSAKMLLLQASGKRPTSVVRPVFAAELLRALEPMVWIMNHKDRSWNELKLTKIDSTLDLCRSNVGALDRYVAKTEKDLMERAREVVTAVRNLDRATRTRGDYDDVNNAMNSAFQALKRVYEPLAGDLARESN